MDSSLGSRCHDGPPKTLIAHQGSSITRTNRLWACDSSRVSVMKAVDGGRDIDADEPLSRVIFRGTTDNRCLDATAKLTRESTERSNLPKVINVPTQLMQRPEYNRA